MARSEQQEAVRAGMGGDIRPIGGRSVVDLVIAEIRRSLLARTLVPGAPFSIAELSERLGVSHIPVREALRRMEAEGLVELRAGRSARVAPMTRDDLRDVFRLRALIEGEAAARSVGSLTDDELAEIERAWEDLLVTPSMGPDEVFLRHREFHELLEKAAGPWDRRLIEMLRYAGDRYTALLIVEQDMAEGPTNLRELHRGLVDAAKSRSAERARDAVHEHLAVAVEIIEALLDRQAEGE